MMEKRTMEGYMNKRVMIVDDSAFMRLKIKQAISKIEGFIVIEEACDGLDALKKYGQAKPDIITLDVNMPGMNGIETLAKLMEERSDIVVIMITPMDQGILIREALAIGAKEFIVKPFKEEKVCEVLQKYR